MGSYEAATLTVWQLFFLLPSLETRTGIGGHLNLQIRLQGLGAILTLVYYRLDCINPFRCNQGCIITILDPGYS